METVKPFNRLLLLDVVLRAEGLSYDAIAQRLEITPKTIYHWRHNPQWGCLLKVHQ
jgi:transposase